MAIDAPVPAPPSLLEWARRLDPDHRVPALVEQIEQTSALLTDEMWNQIEAAREQFNARWRNADEEQ